MALTIFELFGTIAVNNDPATKGIDDTVRKASDAQKTISNVARGLERAFAVAAAAVAALGVKAVKYNATIEQYTKSFEVMTGSAEKAAEVTERLRELGAATPFEMTELADATQLLMQYGFTADGAVESMMMLGDISQGSADKMHRIAIAYGQMSSSGKVLLEDVKQMIEAGFNPLQEISASTGESMESLYERISNGTMAVDEITDAMERSTAAGGKYFQSMQKQSQTLAGKWSTLKDTASQALGKVMAGLSEWLSSDGIPAAIEAVEWLSENFEDLLPVIEMVVAAAAGMYAAFKFQKIIDGIKAIGAALTTSTGIAGIAVAAISAFVVAFANAYKEANVASESFQEFTVRIDAIKESCERTITAMHSLKDSFNETMVQSEMSAEKANEYLNVIERISEDGVLAADEQEEFNAAVAMLQTLYPNLQIEIDETTGLIKDGTTALRENIEAMQDQAQAAALQEVVTEAYRQQYAAMTDVMDAQQEYNEASAENQAFQREHAHLIKETNALLGTNFTTLRECADATSDWTGATLAKTQEARELNREISGLVQSETEHRTAVTESMYTLGEAQMAYSDTTDQVEGYETALMNAAATGDYSADAIMHSYNSVMDTSTETRETVVSDAERSAQGIRDADIGGAAADVANEVEENFDPDLYQGGVNAIAGAERGMESRRGSLIRKVIDIASEAYRKWNWSFQIYSPSRIMKKSGEFIMEGAEEGINSKAGDVIRSMTNVARNVQEAFDPELNQDGYSLNADSGIEAIDAYATAQKQSMQTTDVQTTETSNNADEIRELRNQFREFVEDLPEMMVDAFATMKFDVNNREFARLVKAVN